ncbi:hypothetical protein Tco_0518151 [Tanacetum coccineum]
MTGDDKNKNDCGSGGITYESPYYLYPSDYPKQLDENRTPHESAAFKAFQRCNDPPGVNKERSRAKSVEAENKHCTECNKDGHTRESCFKTSLIPGLTYEDYQFFLKHFSGTGNSEGTKPVANMAHKEDEEVVNKKTTHFEAPVDIPNGDSIPVKGKRDYILLGGTKVNGVLYVPDFKYNLLFFLFAQITTPDITSSVSSTVRYPDPSNFVSMIICTRCSDGVEHAKAVKAFEKNGLDIGILPEGKRDYRFYGPTRSNSSQMEKLKSTRLDYFKNDINQMEGVDYHDTFARLLSQYPISLISNTQVKRVLEDIATLDVNKAFLHGDLDEEVYKKIPQADPRNNHLEAANHVLGYLKATPGQGILLSRAGDPVLTESLIVTLTVFRSEAEVQGNGPPPLGKIIRFRWLLSRRDGRLCLCNVKEVESKEIIPMKIRSKMQIADLLTKGLLAHQHQFLLGKIGITNLHAPS